MDWERVRKDGAAFWLSSLAWMHERIPDERSLTLLRFSDTLVLVMRLFVLILFLFVLPLQAQIRPKIANPRPNSLLNERIETRQSPEARALLQRIEQGILGGSVETFSASFGKQVSMTISGAESGYYSGGQPFLILRNFFPIRKPTQFAFSRTNDTVASPYATGRLSFIRRGSKESVQVYVSFTRQESQWVITHFNIY